MDCPACGTANGAGDRFCVGCGARLATLCEACGAVNPPSARFCRACGTAVGAPAPAEAPGVVEAASPSVAAEAGGPITERRTVSVLFADLVGFTAISESRDPEEVREILDRYFAASRAAIESHGGTIEKFIGDAVMAVWGTPVANEDDAELAVRAGLELVARVGAMAVDGATALAARAAVMTGEVAVAVGAVGQGMVAGDLVNTASRLQAAAQAGAVLVGDATRLAASRSIGFEPAGEHLLKGKAAPVSAWRATGVLSRLAGAGRSDALEPPFVGRDSELRLLKELYVATASERRAHLVSITGVAGIGKSRLAWELEKYLGGIVAPVWWHQGRSPAYGEGLTFWALGEMIRRRSGIAETDDPADTAAKLRAMLDAHVPDPEARRWIEPRLAALLAVADAPAGDRDELFAAWRRVFESLAETAPVVLVFEDLHWADAALLDFIESVLLWSRAHPILVVTLARPELFQARPTWGAGQRAFTAFHLDPLPEDAMRALLDGLVPDLPASLVERILARAEGIPLYAVETVRMLLDSGRLVATDGTYRASGPIDELAVPETLAALVTARLDRLDASDRRLLQDAAVLGQTFTLEGLAGVTGARPDELVPRLDALVVREVLVRDADPRSPERGQYGFVQALMREVAAATMARRDRRDRHLAAARYFESLETDEVAGVLASHYLEAFRATPDGPERGALGAQTRLALGAAAARASELQAHERAISYLEQAIAIADDREERDTFEERLGVSAHTLGRYAVARERLASVLAHRRATGDTSGGARVATELGRAMLDAQDTPGAIALLEQATREIPAEAFDQEDAVGLRLQLGRALMMEERTGDGVAIVEPALAAAQRLGRMDLVVDGLITKGALLDDVSDRTVEGIALLHGARTLAVRHGLASSERRALGNIAALTSRDDPMAANAAGKDAFDLAMRMGARGDALYGIGWATSIEYDWAGSLALLDDVQALDPSPQDRLNIASYRMWLLAFLGRLDEASAEVRITEELREVVLRLDQRLFFAGNPAIVALLAGRFDEAGLRLAEALRIESWVRIFFYPWATRSAAMGHDASALRAVVQALRANERSGRWLEATRVEAAAALAAVEGRRAEALAGFVDASRRYRELGTEIDLGWADLELVALLGPDGSETRSAAREAREIWTRKGSPPMLAFLDAASAGSLRPRPEGASVRLVGATSHHAAIRAE